MDLMPSSRCNHSLVKAVWRALVLGLLFSGLALVAWLLMRTTQPPALDAARAELRRKNLADLRVLERHALETYAWLNRSNGIIRLPLSNALTMSVKFWQDPVAGRSNLLARLERATAKPPEPFNPYE
jgi:hypothetical protein